MIKYLKKEILYRTPGGKKLLFNRIVQFRTYNKLEPATIAKALNVELDEYLKYEDGSITPNISVITDLAKIYKVTINEFYGHTPRLTLHSDDILNDSELSDNGEFDELKFAELSIDEKELILAYRTSENKEQIYKIIIDKK